MEKRVRTRRIVRGSSSLSEMAVRQAKEQNWTGNKESQRSRKGKTTGKKNGTVERQRSLEASNTIGLTLVAIVTVHSALVTRDSLLIILFLVLLIFNDARLPAFRLFGKPIGSIRSFRLECLLNAADLSSDLHMYCT